MKPAPEGQRLVWCLLGKKGGDNTQVLALCKALGWGCEHKSVIAQPWELLVHMGIGPTLAGIDRIRSSLLQPPWPDLVISAGRRNESVARWIRQQAEVDNPERHTRLVHVGRPWSALDQWDLLVTTPQYFLPSRDNVHLNELPLHDLQRESLLGDGEDLLQRIGDLPRPYTVLLVGGDSGRFVFTADKGRRLGEAVNQLVQKSGGSLLVSNSPRTPDATFDALLHAVDVPRYSYRWRANASDNPYRGLLALGNAFVVTGESMSMLAEAGAMGQPLYIFDMGDGDKPWWRLAHNYRYKPLSHHLAMAIASPRMRREVGRIQQALVDGGHAAWLGDPDAPSVALSSRELAETALRVKALF